jgi:hypothetical protein
MRRLVFPAVAAALLSAGCGSNFDVEKAVKLTDVHTGWYDAGIQDGKNKLVPSVSFKLQNVSGDTVDSVQVNAIFRRVGENEAWGEHFATAIDRDGLQAHQTTPGYVVLRSNLGYTGTESRLQMLQNTQFVDAKVEVYGKHGARTWQKLGEYTIDRQLLTE